MKNKTLLMLLLALLLNTGFAAAQTTSFTYQGRLTDSGSPATGNYDLQFILRDAATNQIGNSLTVSPVTVSNGLFTVLLDFGADAFDGSARWIEIGVRTNGGAGVYTMLTPRQPTTVTPYAIQAARGCNRVRPFYCRQPAAGVLRKQYSCDALGGDSERSECHRGIQWQLRGTWCHRSDDCWRRAI